MIIHAKHLKPGMVLLDDVKGKSGKPIVPRDKPLTTIEIEFIQKFLVETVNIARTKNGEWVTAERLTEQELSSNHQRVEMDDVTTTDSFNTSFNQVVKQFKQFYFSWQANVPINMYDIRQLCLPLFDLVETKSIDNLIHLVNNRDKDTFYYKTVVVALLAIKLAQRLNYDKRDWLQIGFAAILIDIGLTKSKLTIESEQSDY